MVEKEGQAVEEEAVRLVEVVVERAAEVSRRNLQRVVTIRKIRKKIQKNTKKLEHPILSMSKLSKIMSS